MKRLLPFLVIPFLLLGCRAIDKELDDIKDRLLVLEGSTISSIDEQISSITRTINALTQAREDLEKKDGELEDLIQKLNGQINGDEGLLAALNKAKEDLEKKDLDLEEMIRNLKTFVENSLRDQKGWIESTFATLEQYQSLSNQVANLTESLKTTFCTLEQYEQLKEELKNLATGTALVELESSLKTWVGEALSGYYDIAAIDAKLSALATSESVNEEIENLKGDIEKAKGELTEAYKKAIEEAISKNNGVIDAKIAQEIGSVQSRIDKEVEALEKKIGDLETRIKNLEEVVDGLKVSDQIFGFVNYAQADTITKGLPYLFLFRVNPSGVPFTKDMVVLDNMSSKKFLYTPESRASYITESKNFVADSLGKSRNAANEETDGQYVLRLKTTETRNLIDDNVFSLVGAYRDKEQKVQYVSSTPFQLVMMPTPEEGLTSWGYAHGNVTFAQMKSVKVPSQPGQQVQPGQDGQQPGQDGQQPGQDGQQGQDDKYINVWTETLGSICYSFDHRTYRNEKDNNDTRTYSCKNLRSFVYEGNSKKDSIVIMEPHRDSGYVRFIPDTTKAEWAALLDTTKHTTLKVSGKIRAFDRYGGSSTFPVEMTWYSRCTDTMTVNLKVADFFETTADGEKRKTVQVDVNDMFKKRGYISSEVNDLHRKRNVKNAVSQSGSTVLCNFDSESDTVVNIRTYVRKENLPGTYKALVVQSLTVFPSELSQLVENSAIECPIVLKIVITE